MLSYKKTYDNFDPEAFTRGVLTGRLSTGLNPAVECCDRWADDNRAALHWMNASGQQETVLFRDLQERSARFANFLNDRGIGPGDVVAGLLPRIPELLSAILGTWRAGAVYQPLFTAFGPKAIQTRVSKNGGSAAKLILTDPANRSKLDDVVDCPESFVIDRSTGGSGGFAAEMSRYASEFTPVIRGPDDPFLTLFTSGTTGNPKGVIYPVSMLPAIAAYMIYGIGLRESDRFWCMADPGWAYGLLYAVVGPLLIGQATTMYEGPFSVDSAVVVIKARGITNLAGAPTVYRLMMAAGSEAMAPISSQLRLASSAGEPLNPELSRWATRVLGCPLHDHYGQSENGMILNNHHGLEHEVKEGSAGLPMPGMVVEILDDKMQPVEPGQPGILAVNLPKSTLNVFHGYGFGTGTTIEGEWYLTGDTMKRDSDGYYYFVGRSDDLITSSGYRIGPFDVESAMIEHASVAEVAVVGKPDPERTEIVKAFVVLREGYTGSEELVSELQKYVRTRMAAHAFPREIAFVDQLPKTPSGKVQRFLLRQQ